jgi:DNA-binding NarL/FixJ family response regulator
MDWGDPMKFVPKGQIMRHPVRVLITDDSPQSREGLRALLATWPEVDVVGEASDGREAVRLVEERLPDVVLMDAHMPVFDGVKATRLIKASWPGVRVVVLTLYPSYRADVMAAGADAFLLKGHPTRELLDAIVERSAHGMCKPGI